MSGADVVTLLPLMVIGAAAVTIMLQAAFYRHHLAAVVLTLLGLALSLASLLPASRYLPRPVTPLLVLDRFALFYVGLILAACIGVTLLSYGYLKIRTGEYEEFYALLLLATLGAMVLVTSSHFVSFFLGLGC
ncbi:MAG: hypothetical protein M5R38_14710 [Candidatus Methylomirabilis sp.]|nr:hypothetical protein [Candidatus Methylomirabilis sp.]